MSNDTMPDAMQDPSSEPKRSLRNFCAADSQLERRERSQYLKEFAPTIVGYIVTLLAVVFVVDSDVSQARNYLILLPVIPVAMAAVAVYRSVRRVDEYTRQVQITWMAVAFGVSMVGLVALGLLATVGIHHEVGPWLVFMAAMLVWGLGSARQLRQDA